MFPETYMVGFEIRVKVSDYVNDRLDFDIIELMWAFHFSHSTRNKLTFFKLPLLSKIRLSIYSYRRLIAPFPKLNDFIQFPSRFLALRQDNEVYHNAGVIRTNAMKYLPNFFRKGLKQT